jgi:hypothetical protein
MSTASIIRKSNGIYSKKDKNVTRALTRHLNKEMAGYQLKIFLMFILSLTTYAIQLQYPFKQCSRRYLKISFSISIIFDFYLARSAGQIIKAAVNAPCGNDYCTFYKGTEARLEFTFTLSKIN